MVTRTIESKIRSPVSKSNLIPTDYRCQDNRYYLTEMDLDFDPAKDYHPVTFSKNRWGIQVLSVQQQQHACRCVHNSRLL